jgi:hypothetical protein
MWAPAPAASAARGDFDVPSRLVALDLAVEAPKVKFTGLTQNSQVGPEV